LTLYTRVSARRSLFHTIGFRALSQAATVLSYAVLVRNMSEQAFGVLNLLYSFIPIVATLGSLGIDSTIRRYQPEYLRTGQYGLARWLIRTARLARLSSNLVLIAAILLTWNWVAPWFELTPYRADFAIFSVLILVYFQINILQFSLASNMLHQYSVGSVAILSIGRLAAYLTMASFGELTLRNAILADTFSYGLAYAFLAVAHRRVRHDHNESMAQTPGADELRRLKRFAGFSHFTDSTSLLTFSETDRFFIAGLMNSIAVGGYAFYTRLSDMAASMLPQKLFDNLVQPMFFGIPAQESSEKIPRYFTFLLNINLAYQLPLVVFSAVYHHEIVAILFGGKFLEHSSLLPLVIAFATSENIVSVPVTMVAQYREKASVILKSQAVGIYQVVAMLALVPIMGLMGAVIASGTFHLFRNLFVWWYVRGDAVWTNFRSVLLSAVVIWGVSAWLCYVLKTQLHVPPVAGMACGALVCAVASLVYLRSPGICDSDRQILSNVLHGQEGRLLRWVGLVPARTDHP
jgi:O-antigen/teichoic acid export membrane protein